jgi:hypothetical protein
LRKGLKKKSSAAIVETEFDRIRRVHGENANKLFESVLQNPKSPPLQGGFARLWLNRDTKEGNRFIREALQAIIKQEGGTNVMTAAIAASEFVKWQMRTWNRIYQFFNDKSPFLSSEHGSGIVTIRKGERELKIEL